MSCKLINKEEYSLIPHVNYRGLVHMQIIIWAILRAFLLSLQHQGRFPKKKPLFLWILSKLPFHLPQIWTTFTTVFRRRNSRFETLTPPPPPGTFRILPIKSRFFNPKTMATKISHKVWDFQTPLIWDFFPNVTNFFYCFHQALYMIRSI